MWSGDMAADAVGCGVNVDALTADNRTVPAVGATCYIGQNFLAVGNCKLIIPVPLNVHHRPGHIQTTDAITALVQTTGAE